MFGLVGWFGILFVLFICCCPSRFSCLCFDQFMFAVFVWTLCFAVIIVASGLISKHTKLNIFVVSVV